MALYIYLKKATQAHPKPKLTRVSKFFSVFFFIVGIFLIGQAVVPIAGWYIFASGFSKPIISPLASNGVNSYNPSTWFIGAKIPERKEISLKTYTLSIPKLKIESAIVKIDYGDEESLKKSLIGWPNSGLPGTYGNAVIFGHSALPQVSTPTNYSTIFTFLMDLNEGDEIFVDFDDVRYKYVVFDKKVVDPTDLSVLEQRFDASHITLITCVPPGTTWKRGIIKARMAGNS